MFRISSILPCAVLALSLGARMGQNIVLDNRFVINDDSDSWDTGGANGASESGCGWYFHDSKVDIVSLLGNIVGHVAVVDGGGGPAC